MSSNAYITDSVFEDNYGQKINHGITMITSNLEFYNSEVSFSKIFASRLELAKLDTGFFSLFLGSKIYLGRNTNITNLKAMNYAVLSAFSLSSVFIEDNVNFIGNIAQNPSG